MEFGLNLLWNGLFFESFGAFLGEVLCLLSLAENVFLTIFSEDGCDWDCGNWGCGCGCDGCNGCDCCNGCADMCGERVTVFVPEGEEGVVRVTAVAAEEEGEGETGGGGGCLRGGGRREGVPEGRGEGCGKIFGERGRRGRGDGGDGSEVA